MSCVVVRPQWLLLSRPRGWHFQQDPLPMKARQLWHLILDDFFGPHFTVSTGLNMSHLSIISSSWGSWGAWWSTTRFHTGTGNLLMSFVRCVPTDVETFCQMRPRHLVVQTLSLSLSWMCVTIYTTYVIALKNCLFQQIRSLMFIQKRYWCIFWGYVATLGSSTGCFRLLASATFALVIQAVGATLDVGWMNPPLPEVLHRGPSSMILDRYKSIYGVSINGHPH